MCGIVGIVHRDAERPVDPAALRTMCDAIRHRGPDDEGTLVSGPVGLGMRRLSIIDLAGGRQPMTNEDGSQVIVFNGEIYNYRELRRELVRRRHRFRTHSDTETIVHLYEEHGPHAVERLRGMFAFAIWDGAARSLFLARDRFGIKPLYYVVAPWGIAFASELKALVAAGLTARELDWYALDAYVQLGYIPAPATPFHDVRKLEPGHWLLWRETGAVMVHPYWDLPRHETPAPPDIADRLVEWLDDSVAAHLVSDVPVAAFLSGGLDSSAVVASMAVAGEGPPHAFTARYFGSGAADTDETELARQLARRYDARLTIVDIRPNLRESFEPIVRALDEPHADDSAVPTWALSQAVGSSYKVALTGIGGDELFAGYWRHLGLLGKCDDRERAQLYSADLRVLLPGGAAGERLRRLHRDAGAPRGLAAALYLDYKVYLADDILALSDRLSMAHSLELRVPLVDHILAERVFPLPARLKLGGWKLKHLLKRALAGRLPAAHLTAPKRGFVGPTAAWLRDELRPMLQDELSASRITRLGYFDPGAVARLIDEHCARRHNREGILWALLCFSTWHRLYVEGPAVPRYEGVATISAPASPRGVA